MAAPTLSRTAQRLYDALAPLAADDARHGYALAHYCAALAKLFDQVADVSRDDEDTGAPGWTVIFDPDEAPVEWLPWMAQFIGVNLPDWLPEADKRARIKAADGFRRGTVGAMVAAARAFLTGTRTVFLFERHGGSAYRLAVSTLASETPDPARVEQALVEQKPAGIVLTHNVVTGGDFNALRDTHSDFADVAATFANFDAVRDNPAQQ